MEGLTTFSSPPDIKMSEPVHGPEKPIDKNKNSGENSEIPEFSPIYDEDENGPGRQRAKDGTEPSNGTRQLFELYWDERKRGQSFGDFFKDDLSDDMRAYYLKHYINEKGRSHGEYKRWYREWLGKRRERNQKFGIHRIFSENSPGTHRSQIIEIGDYRNEPPPCIS